MKFSRLYLYMRSIPKTLYFNFKYFTFKEAIKIPILVSYNVVLLKTKGKVTIKNPTRFGVKIGFGGVGIFDMYRSRSIWEVSGHVSFEGRANIGSGSKLSVRGLLEIGDDFAITAESSIICNKHIKIGNGVLMSWENLIMDTDFHKIYNKDDKEVINPNKDIIINDNVWIGCRCTILKGTEIESGNVIAANSVLSGKYTNKNTILGGNPPKILKNNINWCNM